MQTSKVVLITGASSGIGLETARILCQQGYHVFGTSRDADTPSPSFEMLSLDVRSPESARDCVQKVIDRTARIDVLVNNAGIDLFGAGEEFTEEEIQSVFETNFFGAVRMMREVLPHMRRQRSGQIINISSALGFVGAPFCGLYTASKHALEGFSESLWYEVKPFNIHVSLVEPGNYKTPILSNLGKTAPLADYARNRNKAFPAYINMMETAPPPTDVALTIQRILESDDPGLRYPVGTDSRLLTWSRRLLPFETQAEIIKMSFHIGNPLKLAQKLATPAAVALVSSMIIRLGLRKNPPQ